ncbi:MAG: squalene/phytoene synthase family protein [Janthinobacterium lividum]
MTAEAYPLEKGAPAGSSAYYALREASAAVRPALTALFAFQQELAETVATSGDPGVALTKLGWWHDQTEALRFDDTPPPAHPVLKALAAHLPDPAAASDSLLALIAGFRADLGQTRYLDAASLDGYIDATGGCFHELIAATVVRADARGGPKRASLAGSSDITVPRTSASAPSLPWARSLGRALARAALIGEVGAHARQGRIYLPVSTMQEFGVTAAEIVNRQYSSAFTQLMRSETQTARAALIAARTGLPGAEARRQRTLRAEVGLALALLAEIEASDYQVLHQRIALTPVRKLLCAWRSARFR